MLKNEGKVTSNSLLFPLDIEEIKQDDKSQLSFGLSLAVINHIFLYSKSFLVAVKLLAHLWHLSQDEMLSSIREMVEHYKSKIPDVPFVPAFLFKANGDTHYQLVFYCLHCASWHYHGYALGHRVKHCSLSHSPYEGKGYILFPIGIIDKKDKSLLPDIGTKLTRPKCKNRNKGCSTSLAPLGNRVCPSCHKDNWVTPDAIRINRIIKDYQKLMHQFDLCTCYENSYNTR